MHKERKHFPNWNNSNLEQIQRNDKTHGVLENFTFGSR